MPLGAGRGVQGHAGCGQPEHEPLYSEQELTTQTLSTFLQEGRDLGWGEVIAPQQAALGSRSGPAARDMGNCFSAPRVLAVCLGAGWEGTGSATAEQHNLSWGEGPPVPPRETVRTRGGRGRAVNGRLILGASREACTEAAVTHRRAG